MRPIDLTEQEVPGQPATIVLELRLISESPRAERLTGIVGLNELRGGIHLPHRTHRQDGGSALMQQRLDECSVTFRMGIPMAVER